MATCFLSLGSNLGDRNAMLSFAEEELTIYGTIINKSSIYTTEPWGYESQHSFLNKVIQYETTIPPQVLLSIFKTLEQRAGRLQHVENEYQDRLLDIDLLLYDQLIINNETLTLPHPKMYLRKFVLVPLTEIAPTLRHPLFSQTMTELLEVCPDRTSVVRQKS
ncbi:2-amino-4-hydroxy-6-hydroxymethyldihydropteridine diphosphokinase [Microbacter margulisiae]|nr:2-amino-4-hydroxy-6-hydroxymethyldihydropteridine diphosphokinase [Microbacter margulisiae]